MSSLGRLQELVAYESLDHVGSYWEIKNKRKILTFSSKSGRGRLQEVAPLIEALLGV